MSTQFIIVKNGTKNPVRPVKIDELHKVIPADGKFYKLPYNIAYKYREFLIPVKIIVETDDYASSAKDAIVSDEIVNEKIPLSAIVIPEKKTPPRKKKPIKKKKKAVPKKVSTPEESSQ